MRMSDQFLLFLLIDSVVSFRYQRHREISGARAHGFLMDQAIDRTFSRNDAAAGESFPAGAGNVDRGMLVAMMLIPTRFPSVVCDRVR